MLDNLVLKLIEKPQILSDGMFLLSDLLRQFYHAKSNEKFSDPFSEIYVHNKKRK